MGGDCVPSQFIVLSGAGETVETGRYSLAGGGLICAGLVCSVTTSGRFSSSTFGCLLYCQRRVRFGGGEG
jgi:hypothetical protein